MKATGIVRRIDDLGRVVIPKEIRRTLRIREGDPLEIFTDREGEIILKKYSPIGELSAFAGQYAESLSQTMGCLVGVCDMDQVVAASGAGKKELQDRADQPAAGEGAGREKFSAGMRRGQEVHPHCEGPGRNICLPGDQPHPLRGGCDRRRDLPCERREEKAGGGGAEDGLLRRRISGKTDGTVGIFQGSVSYLVVADKEG